MRAFIPLEAKPIVVTKRANSAPAATCTVRSGIEGSGQASRGDAFSRFGHDFSCVPSRAAPSPIGSWSETLVRAPATKQGDADEQRAARSADASLRNERPSRTRVALSPPDVGTPPWGGGRELRNEERQWHEERTGAALGDVRIHEGAAPSRWARILGARAFTIGRDVVLGSGEYAPGTSAGRHLMAHELSHVVAASGRGPLLARVALTSGDFDALADALHDVISTSTADEELIYVALQKLERDATAIASLKAAYTKRHKASLVTELASRLKGRSLGLAQTLLGTKGGVKLAATPPSTPKDYEGVAKAVNAALVAKNVDTEGLYAELLPHARNSARVAALKTAYTTLFTTDLETDLTGKLSGAEQSYALYLLNAPGPATPHSPTGFKAQPGYGTPPTTPLPAAPGGTVSAGTRAPYETAAGKKGTYGFGVGYTGALSSDSRWLQFIEREIDYTPKGGGTPVALNKEITSGGGKNTYKLSTSPTSPNWVVDSYNPSDPFFDETHSNDAWRDATSVSFYDAPAPRDAEINELFGNGATSVTSRAHFEIYLIRDYSAVYRVEVEIVWVYSAPKSSQSTRTVKAAGPVSGLPSAMRSALVGKYPAYAYIR